jgi:phytoene desaturase
MERPLPSLLEMMKPKVVWGMTQIDGMRSMMRALEEFFRDARLRQLFGRYATYNGSSPYHAPATLSVIAHVENAFGIFACKGGIYQLCEALAARAAELGVEVATGTEAQEILIANGRAVGVLARGHELRADVVVANCDVAEVYGRLLPDSRPARKLAAKHGDQELSLSAYLLLAVAPRAPLDLLHHNVFFSRDYRREFVELVDQRRPPADPTVYLCAEDRPGGRDPLERMFFLTNAPPLDARGEAVDWTREAPECRARVLEVLARHQWQLAPVDSVDVTPVEFESRFPGSRGALYGLASNSRMAAFHRPPNRMPGIAGLYLAGGSVHPGAGMPMACLSARIASQLVLADLGVRA